MKKMFFLCSLLSYNILYGQVLVSRITQPSYDIYPGVAFQVQGTVKFDSLIASSAPTRVLVLDQYDSLVHSIAIDSLLLFLNQLTPVPIIRTYTTNATWTKPVGLKYIVVEMVGGGGNGGNTSGASGGGGGGAGGYSRKIITALALGSTESITVGTTGGTSSFGIHLQASGGTNANDQAGGNGGSGSGGDFNAQGGDGANGDPAGNSTGGKGGSSLLGGGGKAGSANNSNGLNGKNYGGGGGGAHDDGTGSQSGGSGASGVVLITEYY